LGRETGAELVDCWIRSNWKFPEFEELVRIVDLCSLDNSSGLHSLKWLIGTGTEAYYESNIPKHVIQACDAELKNMAYHVKLRELEGKSSDPSLQGVKESMHVLFNACRRLGIIAWETNIRFYWDHAITKLAAEKLSAAVPVAS